MKPVVYTAFVIMSIISVFTVSFVYYLLYVNCKKYSHAIEKEEEEESE